MKANELWQKFCLENNIDVDTPYEAWAFCGGGEAGDRLASLVLKGIKTATASAYDLYFTDEPEPVPAPGEYSVVLDSYENAICVLRTEKVTVVPYDEVTAEHAKKEGEGDLSLGYWRDVHREFFTSELAESGLEFDEKMPVVCEEFSMIYKADNILLTRLAFENEIDDVARLYSSSVGTEGCVWNEYYPTKDDAGNDFKNECLYVTELDGKIIGAASVVPENELDGLEFWKVKNNAAELARIVVSPEYRGNGYSEKTVDAVLKNIENRSAVHLLAAEKNIAAISLYRRLGFEFPGKCEMYGNRYFACEKIF